MILDETLALASPAAWSGRGVCRFIPATPRLKALRLFTAFILNTGATVTKK
jgi:hypothetical protein